MILFHNTVLSHSTVLFHNMILSHNTTLFHNTILLTDKPISQREPTWCQNAVTPPVIFSPFKCGFHRSLYLMIQFHPFWPNLGHKVILTCDTITSCDKPASGSTITMLVTQTASTCLKLSVSQPILHHLWHLLILMVEWIWLYSWPGYVAILTQ